MAISMFNLYTKKVIFFQMFVLKCFLQFRSKMVIATFFSSSFFVQRLNMPMATNLHIQLAELRQKYTTLRTLKVLIDINWRVRKAV